MKTEDLLQRVDHLIQQGNTAASTNHSTNYSTNVVKSDLFVGFKAAGLSFIEKLFGSSHPYYQEFDSILKDSRGYTSNLRSGLAILQAIRHEVENGWLTRISALVTADIFTDFLEIAEHLLDEGYKDAAAVMIGSTLEEHLRSLGKSNKVDVYYEKDGVMVAKKADVLNADLKKAEVYGPIEQKQVTAWLGLRNSAAHGKYSDYTKEQVLLMYQGVLNFISQIK